MNAIDHALLALAAEERGDTAAAQTHLCDARHQARHTAQRERQIVEIATLVVAGKRTRAMDLALVHRAEFTDDGDLLGRVIG